MFKMSDFLLDANSHSNLNGGKNHPDKNCWQGLVATKLWLWAYLFPKSPMHCNVCTNWCNNIAVCCLYLHHLAQNECPHQTKLLCSVYSLFNHCCLFRQCFCSREVSRSLISSKFSTWISRCQVLRARWDERWPNEYLRNGLCKSQTWFRQLRPIYSAL